MCGIAGIVPKAPPVDHGWLEERLRPMISCLAHRGPDAEGLWVSEKNDAGLGHRRLSVIDLGAHANQPFADAARRYRMVFNGEIYNYRELREELAAGGSRFRTASDTEVLLEAYIRWGRSCLQRLDGMYAFAIFDTQCRSLFAARDPFGEKPFYYSELASGFAFASELHALATLPDFDRSVREDVIASYLSFQYIPAPLALYSGARKLPPGHWLVVDAEGSVQIGRHFVFEPAAEKTDLPLDTLADELEALLMESLERRLRADVPLGVFLSGGLDSSVVAALASRRLGRELSSFSVGFAGSPTSEHEQARDTARYLGLDHHELLLEKQDTLDVEAIAAIVDEPNGDTSLLPTWRLCRLARERITVALSGDGSDELFGGYGRYAETLASAGDSPAGDQYYSNRILVHTDADIRGLLGTMPLDHARRMDDARQSIDRGSGSLIDRLRASDVERYMPGAVLAKVDRMSMQCGLEVRTPFLSAKVARFAEKLGPEALVQNGVGKRVLRRVAERYLPQQTVCRRKAGFGLPLDQWGRDALLATWNAIVDRSPRHLAWWLQEPRQVGATASTYQLWCLLVLAGYLERRPYEPTRQDFDPRQLEALRKLRASGRPVTVLSLRPSRSLTPLLPPGSRVATPFAEAGEPNAIALDWLKRPEALRSRAATFPKPVLLLERKRAATRLAVAAAGANLEFLAASGAEATALKRPGLPRKFLLFDSEREERIGFTWRSAWRDLKRLLEAPDDTLEDLQASLRSDVSLFSRDTPRRSLQLARELWAYRGRRSCEIRSLKGLARRPAPPAGPRSGILLFTSSLAAGGAERQVVLLAIALRQLDLPVEVWVTDPLNGGRDHYLPQLEAAGIPTRSLEAADADAFAPPDAIDEEAIALIAALPLPLQSQVWSATRMLLARRPAVLHSFLDMPNIVGGWAGKLAGVPRIALSFRNVNPSHFVFYRPWWRRHYKGLARLPGIFLAGNSIHGNDDYARWLRVPASRVALTPNGIDTRRFRPDPGAAATIRARHALPRHALLIFSAFRLSLEKAPFDYLEVVRLVQAEYPDARFALAGEGPLRSAIEQRAIATGVAGRLILLGRIGQPETYFAAADVALHCSSHEGMPNALLEAHACGVPVVCTDAGGSSEIVVHGETGYVAPVGDTVALSRRLLELLGNASLRARFGDAARRRTLQRFDLRAARDATLPLYALDEVHKTRAK